MVLVRCCLLGLLLFSVVAAPVYSQTAPPDSAATFQAKVRVVLVDVVVTNSKDEPITGLPKEDFQVFEDGQPETLASFEEHAGLPEVPGLALRSQLPPNVFSNLPLVKTGDTANVLLLDALNTPMQDQNYVHAQMIKYIKGIRPGTRLAIFTLGARLRFVQGFTTDASVLMAALSGKKTEGNPQLSPLLPTSTETDAGQRLVAQMQELQATLQAPSAQLQASIDALREFQTDSASFQTDVRIKTTLDAMQQLARYLEGIPGRKNVIWFSSSFPLSILSPGRANNNSVMPDSGLSDPDAVVRQYQEALARTANLLAAAQVAIYPIGAEGLAPDNQSDFSNQQPPKEVGLKYEQQMTQNQVNDLQTGSTERNAGQASMDELAKDTGGEAIYNTNGLNDAVNRVLNDGTHYYTLTYTPTNKKMDSQLRHIGVKLTQGNYRLAYRRGYYADDAKMTEQAAAKPTGDPLRPLMDHGTPDSTEILYQMRVAPSNLQPAPASERAGDNPNLKGPVTRYAVKFTVSPDHLMLEPSADGVRHGNLEMTLVGYDRDGKPLNWLVRVIQFAVPPERAAAVLAAGVGFGMEIDVPAADVYLRSGVYDFGSSKAGTLEIPLAAVVAQAAPTK
jgi:VWFA-related protein